MELIVKNHLIDTPIINIMFRLRNELNDGRLKSIQNKGDNVAITCPFHKGGEESRPSCQVYSNRNSDTEYGICHCFTCGYKARLPKLIADCFGQDIEFGEDWLVDKCSSIINDFQIDLPEITLNRVEKVKTIPESFLDKYQHYSDYLSKRGISEEVKQKFKCGYDPENQVVTFPVYDEQNRLVMITTRSTTTKRFFIQKNIEKPVYLLNYLIRENSNVAFIVESQINALTLQTWGYPACALIGTGSSHQYEILKKCGIKNFILAFDGDTAGKTGAYKFKQNMPSDCFIVELDIPSGKDVNDLTKEQFENILNDKIVYKQTV